MNPPTNVYQLRSPAGHPDIPYRPACTQLYPQAVEGGNGWGPIINDQWQNWFTLEGHVDVDTAPSAYQVLHEYGLCVNGGDPVPFVAVDTTKKEEVEEPSMPEPLRLLAEGANVETPAPASNYVNPNLARLAPVETQAAEEQPVDVPAIVQQPGDAGFGILFLVGGASLAAWLFQQWETQMNVAASVHEEPEQEPADVSLAYTPERPAVSAGVYAGNPYSTGISIETNLETGVEMTLETDRNDQKISRNGAEKIETFLETGVEMKFSPRQEVSSLKNAIENLEIRRKQEEINRKRVENGEKTLEMTPSISRNYTPNPEVVNALLTEIRSRTTKSAQPMEQSSAHTKREQEWGAKGCYKIDLETGTITNEDEAKLFCFDLIAEGETSTTKLMWRVFGVTGGTNKLYKSGYPQKFIADWKQEFSEEA